MTDPSTQETIESVRARLARQWVEDARSCMREASRHLARAASLMPAGGRDRPQDLSQAYDALDNVRDLHEAVARYAKQVDSR